MSMEFPENLRKTKSRIQVWEVLSEAKIPLTARKISEDSGVWLSSVYRALDAFEKSHAVSKTVLKDSQEALYAIASPGHHHYAICMNCKSRTELEGCPFGDESALHTVDHDFVVVGHVVEVFGYCKKCRGKMQKSPHSEEHGDR
ncbi:MAG: transcriptional repressor [Clostridiales bacterium]|nr:transcriptional repressor [Clostridiales bacterium]